MNLKALVAGLVLALPLCAAEKTSTPPAPARPAAAPEKAEEEKPTGPKTEQLAAAQKQLAILKLRHDERHPAVLKQRAKVARLQQDVRTEEKQRGPLSPGQQLSAAKDELEEARKKFTDEHPRVKALQRQIAELERQR